LEEDLELLFPGLSIALDLEEESFGDSHFD
jgi:hypothetical protein